MFFANKKVWKLPLIILLSFVVFSFAIYADGDGGEKVLIYVGDGVVPEFTNQFISEGVLDNLSRGLESGVFADHGIMPPLPPNTGPSWPTIFTGAFTGVHGITNNSFHNTNNPITQGSWSWAGSNQAESIATAAEKAGLSVVTVGGAWPSWPPDKANIDGPVLTWPYQWTLGGVISNYEIEGVNLAPYLYVDYKKTDLADASDSPINSFSPPKTSELKPKDYMGNVLWNWDLYVIDTTNDNVVNYDTVYIYNKDEGLAILREGKWDYISVNNGDKTGGLEVKLQKLGPKLNKFKLYYTASRGIKAHPSKLEDDLSKRFKAPIPADRNPLMAGLIDEQTFFEQGEKAFETRNEIYSYLIKQYDPDLMLAGEYFTDEIQHRFLGYTNNKSPMFDPEKSSKRWNYIRQSYVLTDKQVGKILDVMGREQTTTLFVSDHGFASFWKRININYRLQNMGLYNPENPEQSKAIAYSAGGYSQIYLNMKRREPSGIVPPEDYETLQDKIVNNLQQWVDPDTGEKILERVLRKQNIDEFKTGGITQDLLNEETTGDIVIFTKPPYQFDAAQPGKLVASAIPYFNGQHGYLPESVPSSLGNTRATFIAFGSSIQPKGLNEQVGLWQVAPTAADILNIPAPENASGKSMDIIDS